MGTQDAYVWIIIAGGLASFITAFAIGCNDVANTFSMAVGSRAISLRNAIIMAFVLESLGALLFGKSVAEAVRSQIIDIHRFESNPEILMYGMLCSLVAAGVWVLLATYFAMPVSTTHSIVGAIVGFGLASGSGASIQWFRVYRILISWVLAPVVACFCGAAVFCVFRKFFLRRENALSQCFRYSFFVIVVACIPLGYMLVMKNPFYYNTYCNQIIDGELKYSAPCYLHLWSLAHPGYTAALMAGSTLLVAGAMLIFVNWRASKCIKQYKMVANLEKEEANMPPEASSVGSSPGASSASSAIAVPMDKGLHNQAISNSAVFDEPLSITSMQDESGNNAPLKEVALLVPEQFDADAEKFFAACQLFSSSLGCLAHSANDTANAIGPFFTMFAAYNGDFSKSASVPWYLLLAGGVSMSLGLALFGYRVIHTLGKKLLRVTPSRGYSVDLSAASIVIIFSAFGMPLSTTHCAVGAATGVGLSELSARLPKNTSTVKLRQTGIRGLIDSVGHSVNLHLLWRILFSWVITIFFSSLVSMLLFSFGAYAPALLR